MIKKSEDKAYKIRTAPFALFFIFGFIFILSFSSSLYAVDFSCPGGQWVLTSSCGSCYGVACSDPRYWGENISGATKTTTVWWCGSLPSYPCSNIIGYEDIGCLGRNCPGDRPPSYGSTHYGWLDCCLQVLRTYEWRCPAACTDGQTQA